MDGIFGIGLAEMLIIALALFVVGGPQNTAKWARELGKLVRQLRHTWAEMMADIETELGPEGKELMDAARELGKGAREVSSMARPTRLVGDTLRMVETALDEETTDSKPAASTAQTAAQPAGQTQEDTPSANGKKYTAWLPPEQQ
jgi:Sec-independent protein translocase protein TatA